MRATVRPESNRQRELRAMLEHQRAQLLSALRTSLRGEQAQAALNDGEVQDEAERSETDIRSGLEFALLQMQSETLAHIEEAIRRLDAGTYGDCAVCGSAIPAARLSALPFAIRCRRCEQAHETSSVSHDHASMAWPAAIQLLDVA